MKNKLLKLADSLLSKEEMKSLKGGDYPPGGGGGGGGGGSYPYIAYCYNGYSGNSISIPVASCDTSELTYTWAVTQCSFSIYGTIVSCG